MTTPEMLEEDITPIDDTVQEPEIEVPPVRNSMPVANTTHHKSPFSPEVSADIITEIVALPSMMRRQFVDLLGKLRNNELVTTGDKAWHDISLASVDVAPSVLSRKDQLDLFEKTLTDIEREWVQKIDEIMARPMGAKTPTGKLTGTAAVQAVRSRAGLSTYFGVPLYHTGGHITFRSPSEGSFLSLMDRISEGMEEMGRRSNGMFLSSEVAYLNEIYMDAALACMEETTIANDNYADLKEKISVHDIPAVIWGMASAFWSRGYRYKRSCVAGLSGGDVCRHVMTEMMDLRRMQYVDAKALNTWQRRSVLSARLKESITPEMLKRYKQESPQMSNVKVDIIDGVSIELEVCSAAHYFECSRRWMSEIEETYVKGMSLTEAQRAQVITDQAKASSLRQYTHFVKAIYLGEDAQIDDLETIEDTLSSLSGDDVFRNTFFEKIQEFIENTTVSVLGIPSFKCPACGRQQQPFDENEKFSPIIPINVPRLFFYLFPQRKILIRNR